MIILISATGTQYGYRLSKPVYHCDVTENGALTCRDKHESNHTLDLGVVCGPPPDDERMSTDTC